MDTVFEVVGVVERPQLSPANELVTMVVITLKTLNGARGSVSIPSEQYDALTATDEGKEMLRQTLQQKADALDAPFTLQE